MSKLKRVPFEFMNEATETQQVLTLSGSVRKRFWGDDEVVDAKSVRDALDGVDKPILIKLNSPGGDVFEGIEIYNYIKNHEQPVTVEIMGVAASAASIIAMGADKIIMNTGTSLMIHEASTWTFGNKSDIQKTLNALETIDDSLVAVYVERTGLEAEEISDLLKAETWMTADEAVEKGFADEVRKAPKAEPKGETKKEEKVNNKVVLNVDTSKIIDRLDDLTKRIEDAIKSKTLKQAEEPVAKPRNLMSKLRGGL